MNKAEELIACLEGEIAKRDETMARLEPQLNRAIQANYDMREELAACWVAVENCDVFRARIAELERELGNSRVSLKDSDAGLLSFMDQCKQLRAELSALKAQEPVAWVYPDQLRSLFRTCGSATCAVWNKSAGPRVPLYAAPVSEAKAQGVVMPERLKPSRYEIQDARADAWNSCLDEVARLNASPAAPAADAGLIEALELAANRLDRLALEQGEFWRGYATAWADEARATANGVKS